jgi:hypothetical protein
MASQDVIYKTRRLGKTWQSSKRTSERKKKSKVKRTSSI